MYRIKTSYQDVNSRAELTEMPKAVPILQFDGEGELVARHDSATKAQDKVPGCDQSKISKCCKGERDTHAGFTWKYEVAPAVGSSGPPKTAVRLACYAQDRTMIEPVFRSGKEAAKALQARGFKINQSQISRHMNSRGFVSLSEENGVTTMSLRRVD